jgi:hypothetical protein
MDYRFTLKYRLPEQESDLDALAERLGSGGGDALLGLGQPGRLALEFTRDAGSSLVELAQATMQVNLARDAAIAAPLPADIVAMLR